MALYETVSLDEFNRIRNPNQTRIYEILSRNNGSLNNGEGGDDNFFAKRAKSLENAFGTTGAALAAGINEGIENRNIDERNKRWDQSLDEIYKSAGYNNADEYYDARDAAEKSAFSKIGFDIDDYWNRRADADLSGDKNTVAELDNSYNAAKAKLVGEDADIINRFDEIQDKLKGQTKANADEATQAAKNYEDYRNNSYIGQKVNQDQGKFAGSAINTLSTMFDVMAPGAGVLANSLQGGIEGIADELEQNGLKNFDWNRAGQNALIGATTGAVTGGLNKGLNKIASTTGNILPGSNIASKVGNAGINATRAALNYSPIKSNGLVGQLANNVTQGALRGAASGAVGGATGAGLSAAMNGQDVLGSALEGAKRGAGQGAFAGSVMAGANTAMNAAKNAMNGVPTNGIQDAEVANKIAEQPETKTTEELGLSPAFEPNDTIETRNKWQSIGDQLKTAAKTQKYSALYDSLDGKTASRAVQTGAPDKLSALGVKPENYSEAAKTSDYVNNVVSNIAKNSEIKAMVPDLTNRLSLDNVDLLMPDSAVKKYNSYINQIVADGSTPDEYSAGYLLQKSRELGKAAQKIRTSGTEGASALSQALTDAKYTLRDIAAKSLENAEITGKLTNDQIKQGLAKLGANKQIQDYYTEVVDGKQPTVTDYIRRSSLFEQARDMGNQIEAEKYTRSASKAPTNPMTKLWAASGLEQPANVVLKNTVAPVASGVTKLAGNVIGGVGDAAAKVKDVLGGGETPTPTTTNVPTNAIETAYNPATKVYEAIGRTEGLSNAEQARTADYLVNATQEAKNAQTGGNTLESLIGQPTTTDNTSVYGSMYGTGSNTGTSSNRIVSQSGQEYFQPTGDYWTDVIARAMTAAIDADDVDAFSSLYSMYQDSLSNLQKQKSSSTSSQKLTSTQQRANAAMDSLSRLSNMTPDLGYNLSGIPVIGNIATLGGNDYEGEAKSLAQQIGYMVSGANIKEEEAYNIGKAYVPQPFDSEQTRNLKLQRAYNIIRQYQNGTAEEA